MRKKEIYIGAAVMIMALVCALLLHMVFEDREEKQKMKESELPYIANQLSNDTGVIRVIIKTNGFAQIVHSEVKVQAESGLRITYGGETTECEAGQVITITPDDERFQHGTIQVKSQAEGEKITISSLQRGYGVPSYRGKLELFATAEGIVIVNELSLEEYLYAVVPSEMPAAYELEALKAQAVCARSYAYNQSRDYAYPEYQAHVDDSTSFQVYGNSQEQERTRCAVDETCGEKIWYNNRVATAYYYSTSCGKSASVEAWGSEFNENNQYLKSIEICDETGNAYEKALPWYRWKATIPEQTLCNLLELNMGTEIGNLQSVSVTKQGAGGIAQQITAVGDAGQIVVETENKIRKALGGSGYKIEKQDGTVIESTTLLPSAFFTITKDGGNYIVSGGGYGHGIGMSQNGANEMAKNGKNYREILTTFYAGIVIQ